MGRKDKLLTFMTTNFKDQLDSAILRPGRVDYKLEFTYATSYQISNMYDMYINNKDIDIKKKFLISKSPDISLILSLKFFIP